MTDVRVVDDPAAEAAGRLTEVAESGGTIVLAGGSTPKRAYELAADADWSRATLLFGDERCVGPDDDQSNYAMVKTALLDRLAAPPAAVHRIPGEEGPEAAAAAYEAVVRDIGDPDLVLLGIGSDCHTASLFPGKPGIEVDDRLTIGVPEAGLDPFVPRVSLTVPALARGRELLFLISGEGKREAVARSFGPDHSDTPAARVAAAAPHAVVLVDPAAAEGLR
jgi:6-phosphogluconolactonase